MLLATNVLIPIGIVLVVCLLTAAAAYVVGAIVQVLAIVAREIGHRRYRRRRYTDRNLG